MVRFIFACMAVVAFSMLALASTVLTDGVETAREAVMARNGEEAEAPQTIAQPAATQEDMDAAIAMDPSALNDIETAAGAEESDEGFPSPFTNAAPSALSEPQVEVPAIETPSALEETTN